MRKITGKDLALARIIMGYETQQSLADYANVSLSKIQRYERLEEVDEKILGFYHFKLKWNLQLFKIDVERIRRRIGQRTIVELSDANGFE
jgi:hypothetical protein